MINTRINIEGEVNPRGVIEGNVNASTVKVYPTLENIEITPNKEEQTFKSENYYGYDEVKVNGITSEIDTNIKPENIKKDVSILGVTGQIEELKATELTITPSLENQVVTPEEPNNSFSEVTINKVTSEIDNNIKPENIKEGIDILGVSGNVEELKATEIRITPISEEQTITPEEPYNGFNKVIVGAQSGVNPEEFFDTTINSSNASYFGSRNMIKKLPKIELDSNLKTLSMAFFYLTKITTIPYMDTSNITNMSNMVASCSSLVDFPLLNTSNVTNMNGLFLDCSSLKEIPLLDTSKVTNFGSFVANCTSLESFPSLDTSSATAMNSMFSGCSLLKSVPTMNTINVTNMSNMFANCPALESVEKLNCSKVVDIRNMFLNPHNNLTYLGGFENLGEAYLTSRAENYNYYTLDLSKCPNLTHESLMNVINGLYDIATKGCKPQKLILGSTNLAKLTSDEIAIATNKGWNVS